VYLDSPNSPGFPNSWSIQRVVYRFTSALPGLLTSTDIGPVGQAGRVSFNGSRFDVWGSGADIWGMTDAFQYVFESVLLTNSDIVVRVDSKTDTNPYAKAGVMFRGGFEPGAPHVLLDVKPDGGVELMTRPTAGGLTTFRAGACASFPVWLKFEQDPDVHQCRVAMFVCGVDIRRRQRVDGTRVDDGRIDTVSGPRRSRGDEPRQRDDESRVVFQETTYAHLALASVRHRVSRHGRSCRQLGASAVAAARRRRRGRAWQCHGDIQRGN
jgi:hypothetical protein